MTGIQEAVSVAGTQRNLADLLGVTQQVVSYWVRQGYVPSARVVEVEQVTGVGRDRLVNPRLADMLSKEV
jgi:DNA-binding transcriptional regulator YdaS (Cro superfamily)